MPLPAGGFGARQQWAKYTAEWNGAEDLTNMSDLSDDDENINEDNSNNNNNKKPAPQKKASAEKKLKPNEDKVVP